MSHVAERVVYPTSAMYRALPGDPFRLGYRWVKQARPDGTVEMGVTPLLPEDLLYPEEEDRPVVRPEHTADCITLYVNFRAMLADDPHALVLMDCRVDFSPAVEDALGPDIAVFADADPKFGGGTLHVTEVGARPRVVVEVTSPSNPHNDLEDKVVLYHRAGVACYVIIAASHDAEEVRIDARLLGYRHAPAGYEPIPLDDRGWLRVEPLGCWLTIEDKQVVVIDGTGRPVAPPHDQIRVRQAAEARAAQAEEQTRAAEEQTRAAEEQTRAAEEQTRAANARAEAAEAELAAMLAELRRLRGEG